MSTHKQITHTKHNSRHRELALADPSGFETAYDRRLKEIMAVPEEELLPLNFDVHVAISIVLGALGKIEPLIPAVSKLPGIKHARVTALEDYARAAGEASVRFDVATEPPAGIVGLNEAAIALREKFRVSAQSLVNAELLPEDKVAMFQGLTGYRNVAYELAGWANVLQEYWSAIQGKTTVTLEDLGQAKLVAEELVQAAGERDQQPAAVSSAARIRQQAMTLLAGSYDETRRGILYLRWAEGDADTIAPSFYIRGHKQDVAPTPEPEPAPVPPTPTPVAPAGVTH